MAALWKQDTPLDPTFDRLNRCLADDWFLLAYELRLQAAHATALEAAGFLSKSEREAIQRALGQIEGTFAGMDCPRSDAEDLHTWIEAELTARAGEAGKKIHTARSRNDQVATLLKMFVISAGERLEADLRRLIETCCRRAETWSEIPLVLHTHQQFAAPGNAGFWVLRYAVAWDRLRRHVRHYQCEWQRQCPLGSGAAAGSSIPIDRQVQAKALGFEGPSPNALDSTTTRDECVEFLTLAAQMALQLQSLAADVILFSQTPLGWVKYPKEFGTGSSMMPNKMNPDAMELLRGEANAILAAQVQLMMLMKGLPSGYNRDLQCIKPIIRDTAERGHMLCEMSAAFLERLDFNPQRTTASMEQGAVEATLCMERLVKQETPLREAHHRVAGQVQSGGVQLHGRPREWIDEYQTAGGANPAETRAKAREILAGL